MGHAVYLGPGMPLGPHSTAVACLGIGLDGPFRVRVARAPDITARSFLFRPRVTHHVLDTDDRKLYCYFDPASARLARCLGGMRRTVHGVPVEHRHEADLLALCADPVPDIERILDLATIPAPIIGDPRIAAVAAEIRADPAKPQRAAEKASATDLSTSYFLRRFAEQTGTSFRRYVQWSRMLAVAEAHVAGQDFTRSAADAGFASPSHFSDTFRAMFGLTPTAFAALDGRIHLAGPEASSAAR
ncbi:AraC family transcriptional regulator [Nocardia sp. NPDC051832]|uniref:AraC family transcriptional regulator n=1 Tax=Nocardia sp. NPDC051832 TaxID=3155673 RepID=UPI00343B2F09